LHTQLESRLKAELDDKTQAAQNKLLLSETARTRLSIKRQKLAGNLKRALKVREQLTREMKEQNTIRSQLDLQVLFFFGDFPLFFLVLLLAVSSLLHILCVAAMECSQLDLRVRFFFGVFFSILPPPLLLAVSRLLFIECVAAIEYNRYTAWRTTWHTIHIKLVRCSTLGTQLYNR